MAETSHGTGGLTFDKSKRSWPNELNILLALVIIIVIFEILGQTLPYMRGQSFLFDTRDRFDTIFNEARLQIIILQVAIIGIIALGVTQVIITAGIDLSSGPLVSPDMPSNSNPLLIAPMGDIRSWQMRLPIRAARSGEFCVMSSYVWSKP